MPIRALHLRGNRTEYSTVERIASENQTRTLRRARCRLGPRTQPMHRARPQSGKEFILYENIRSPLLGYSGIVRPSLPHITSTFSPLLENVKNNTESSGLVQNFQLVTKDVESVILTLRPLIRNPRINLPSKQYKAAGCLFAFSETKNGVPRRMHSNIPISVMNKGTDLEARKTDPTRKFDKRGMGFRHFNPVVMKNLLPLQSRLEHTEL